MLQQEFFETQQVCKSVDEEVAKLREKLIAAEAEHEAVAVSAAERESALYSKVQALQEEVDMCRTKVRKPRGDPGGVRAPGGSFVWQWVSKIIMARKSSGWRVHFGWLVDSAQDSHLQFRSLQLAEQRTKALAKRIPMSQAWYAMQVPDCTKTLPEASAHVAFDEVQLHLGVGEEDRFCVAARHPFYEMGNLRRLRMARQRDYPQLSRLKRCIGHSTHGYRPEHDKTYGSDYDGDKATIITYPACVPSEPTPDLAGTTVWADTGMSSLLLKCWVNTSLG